VQLRTVRQLRFHLLLFLLLILLARSAPAQTTNPVLSGLKGIDVQVVILNDSEQRIGVERATLYKIVTDALREYKVNYLPLRAEEMSGRKDPFVALPLKSVLTIK
jgi:hypothetical protein